MTHFKKLALMLMFAGPYNITLCQGIELKQIQSLAQISGTTCGYYALANAHAIQKLFNEGKPLSELAIKIEADKLLVNHFTPFFGSDRVFAEENTPLLNLEDTVNRETLEKSMLNIFGLHKNQLEHAYVIQSLPDSLSCPLRIADSLYSDPNGTALININTKDKENKESRKLVHFIYHIGNYNAGHWVYLGVIKEANKAPYIIHLNSTNAPIEYSKDVQIAIAHIQKSIENNMPLIVHETDEQIVQRLAKEGITYTKEIKTATDTKVKVSDDRQIENDLQLARKLQEEEDAIYAQYLLNVADTMAQGLGRTCDSLNKQLDNDKQFQNAINEARTNKTGKAMVHQLDNGIIYNIDISTIDTDAQLARKLQEEEDAIYARQLQDEEGNLAFWID